ncbi:hypothetical protein [Mixta calida]|uniref:Uncharacterized protein n=1 Tax=Mixta calida TaxID=665913 RepID=A0ABM6RXS1_9GAMM|nr:hypothetical protein [Mixta calida]AUY24338.1 hypothetical protein C2E16_05045 [Mixta calida]KAF0861447.1 hypothetical protein Y888_01140 [Mixta calida B021323]ORM56258.1 hypothetical protein HA40_14940 [Mixta calida]
MLLKAAQARFRYCLMIDREIKQASAGQLKAVQDKLNQQMTGSVGIFNFALPLVLSAFLMMLSFAMMQFSLWQAVTQLLGLPRTMTMVLLVIGSLLCGALYVMPVFLMAKGRMVGLSLHLLLARATLAGAVIYLLCALVGGVSAGGSLICPLLALAFIGLSFWLIRTERFYFSLLFALFCRALRKAQTARLTHRK